MDQSQLLRELRAAFAKPAQCLRILDETLAGVQVVVFTATATQPTCAVWRDGLRSDGLCACCLDSTDVAGPLVEADRED